MENESIRQQITPAKNGAMISVRTTVKLASQGDARKFFDHAKERLFNVNQWQSLTGRLYASFKLTNAEGVPTQGAVSEGNLFKIDIAGLGSIEGQGTDWVLVESIIWPSKG